MLLRLCLALALATGALWAQESFIELRAGYYGQEDKGGNESLDEDETVIEPIVIFHWQATEALGFDLGLYYDQVSSASIDRLSETDGQSGASGDNYYGGYGGVTYAFGESEIAAHLSMSGEYDYQSMGLSLSYALWLNERQSRIKFHGNAFIDTVEAIRFDGSEDGSEDRHSYSLGLSFQHILTPTVTFSVGSTFTYQDGFLESNINRVLVENPKFLPIQPIGSDGDFLFYGYEASEELPDSRLRFALHGRVDKYLDWESFPDTSIGLGARVYADDWGIMAFDVEPSVRQWLVEDILMAELRYRFYVQSEADAYDDIFTSLEEDRTSDPDLAAFSSHTLGGTIKVWATENMWFDINLDYMLRDDDLDAFWGSIGWRFSF